MPNTTLQRALSLIVCALIGIGTTSSTAWAQGADKIDQVVAAHYPPLMIADAPDAPGFAIEMLLEAAHRLDRKLDLSFLPFGRALHELENEPELMMAALFRNPKREEKFIWVAKVFSLQMHFLTRGAPIDSWAEATTLDAIGVEIGSTGDDLLTARDFTNVVRLSRPSMTAEMLYAGRIDAWFLPIELARVILDDLGLEDDLVHGQSLFEVPVYLVASRKIDPDVVRMYRQAFADMRADGTTKRILAKYNTRSRQRSRFK